MHSTQASYVPSGKTGTTLPRFGVAAGAAILFAGVYERAAFYNPWLLLQGLLVFFFALAFGMLALWTVEKGQCRNRPLAIALSSLLAVIGVLATHGWNYGHFVWAVVADNPHWGVWEIVKEGLVPWLEGRIETGWVVNDKSISGNVVIAIWLVELVVVLGTTLFFVRDQLVRAFCEECSEWMPTRTLPIRGVTRAEAEAVLAQRDLATLIGLNAKPEAEEGRMLVLARSACPRCHTAFLTVTDLQLDPSGNTGKRHVLAKHLALPQALSQQLAARIDARDRA